MKKKWLAMLLAVALAFSLLPGTVLTAGAAETPVLTGKEMVARLPSEPPEMIAPETLDQASNWGNVSATYFDGNETAAETAFQEIAALTERLTSGAKAETAKAHAVFDWVAKNISYDYEGSEYVRLSNSGVKVTDAQRTRIVQVEGAVTAFYYRSAVCGGYTNLANLMLALAGLPAAYISGELSDGPHAWTAVYVDGQWILFDATNNIWDVSPDYYSFTKTIEWPDGIFKLEMSRTGQIACSLLRNYDCPAHVTIPDGVTSIGRGAFFARTGLTGVTIPDSVTEIGQTAFGQCTGLTGVTIPDSVTSIGSFAFQNCAALAEVTIPASVTSIGESAFSYCSSLISVDIPDGVTEIGSNTFYGCSSLTGVTIPDGVTSIGKFAFQKCTALTEVTIPASVTSMGDHVFTDCAALTKVTILGGLTGIEGGTFNGCSSLTSMTLPASVTSIGEWAFYNCSSLTDVYYSGSEEQWNAIAIASYNGRLSRGARPSATIHHNRIAFFDISASEWYADAVVWAVSNGITNGSNKEGTLFSPDNTCLDVQILTFLYRASGETATTTAPITVESWYQDAVNWAYEKGLINKNYNPNIPCTRAQAVTYIWKAFGKPEAKGSNSFTDVSEDADYAKAVAWVVEKGITNGYNKEGTEFAPYKTCSRGQIVTFLRRAYVPGAALT